MGDINTPQTHINQILNNSPDGMFTISPELEIQYVNPAFCRLLGFSEDELLGTQITEYLGDLHILEACMVEVSANGHCHDQETIFKRKDGSVVHISKNVQAIMDENGHFVEILVSIRDLSDLHQLNKDLEESKRQLEENYQDLETTLNDLKETQAQLVEAEKLASLGGLVAGVAHEINTPLGISVTSATTLHEELSSLNEKFQHNALKRSELEAFIAHSNRACDILNTNLQRAASLVRSFKQVAVDQTVDELRKINLAAYLDEVLMSIGPSFKHSGVSMTNDCDPDIEISTYPGAIYQIISNLVINAITHAFNKNDGGKITIVTRRNGNDLELTFSDDGKGIQQEDLGKIFTPFFTTRRGLGGSGLGLSIVYNLVTGRLNGKITVSSTVTKGTHFLIRLPLST